MKKVLVTGANGQLGRELADLALQSPHFEFLFFDRKTLNIVDPADVKRCLEQQHPDYVINCAAYTAVDKAESELEADLQVNCDGAAFLAKACFEEGAKFIHISTDYVFDGNTPTPLEEDAPTNPVNAYGLSKLEGEKKIRGENPDAVIVRTSWLYSSYGSNFVKTMLRLMSTKQEIGVVADQMGSPTYAADLAKALLQMIISPQWQPGIFHFSNDGITTWFAFANEIQELSGKHCNIQPLTTEQYPTPAKRPAYSVMDKTKIQQVYGVQLEDWKESLRRCLQRLNEIVVH